MWDKIRTALMAELEEITEKEKMTAGDVEAIYKMVDIIKDICEIESYKSESYDGRNALRDRVMEMIKGTANTKDKSTLESVLEYI